MEKSDDDEEDDEEDIGERYDPLPRGSLPEGVVHLLFGKHFQHQLDDGVLPSTLRTLAFSPDYERSFTLASCLTASASSTYPSACTRPCLATPSRTPSSVCSCR